jgi:acyl-CoA reductase-like NAD-dependent aldehyde dehydrogenase
MQTSLFINDAFLPSGEPFSIHDPATGSEIVAIINATFKQVDAAVGPRAPRSR